MSTALLPHAHASQSRANAERLHSGSARSFTVRLRVGAGCSGRYGARKRDKYQAFVFERLKSSEASSSNVIELVLGIALAITLRHGDPNARYGLYAVRDKLIDACVLRGISRTHPWLDSLYDDVNSVLAHSKMLRGSSNRPRDLERSPAAESTRCGSISIEKPTRSAQSRGM